MSEIAITLLERISKGDEMAMKEFFEVNSNVVYRYVLSRENNEVLASEILNEVMLEVWKKPLAFEGRSALSTWLISIARFKVIDYYRAQKRHYSDELDDQMEDEGVEDAPIHLLDNERHAGFISHCMEQLSVSHREVVHLTFFEELPYPEIAQALTCSVGTVKSRMFHAKEKLKQCVARISRGEINYEFN